eukprot:1106108-Pelagomonas_calceolata.AAC.1
MVLERCLTRKPPSTDDLRTLLPMVWWPGCNEEGASREGMEEAMAKFSATLAKVGGRGSEVSRKSPLKGPSSHASFQGLGKGKWPSDVCQLACGPRANLACGPHANLACGPHANLAFQLKCSRDRQQPCQSP